MVLSVQRHGFSAAILISGVIHAGLGIALLYRAWSTQAAPLGQTGLTGQFVELGSVQSAANLVPRAPVRNLKALQKSTSVETQNLNVAEDSDVSVPVRETSVVDGAASQSRGDAQSGQYDEYTRELVRLIHQKKVYPRMAQKMGHTGRILVTLRIGRDGAILDSAVVEESQFSSLNDAAKALIKDLQRMKPFPEGVSEKFWVFHVPIEYKL